MEHGDNAGNFPTLESARAYVAGSKHSNTSADYHSDRIRALRLLLRDLPKASSVLDFGCGDGMYIRELCGKPKQIVGIDISGPMIQLATENLRDLGFIGHVGGVEALQGISGSFDLAFAIDVLGYLEPSDLDTFYKEVARLLRPGGHLVVMYGNELFDMFALNAGTAAFFQKHFSLDVAELLIEGRSAQYKPANRKNPLSFGAEIAPYGLREINQAFSQWHRLPPGLGNRGKGDLSAARLDMRDHGFDPNQLAPAERWKAAFRSSIFASLSTRV